MTEVMNLSSVIRERVVAVTPGPREGRLAPRVWVYVGVIMVAAGCGLLAVAWGLAAGQTQVALQIPYVMSAGFPGVGLGVVGIALVVLGTREADARARHQQNEELIGLLTVLRDEVKAAEPTPTAPSARARRTRKAAG